MTLLNRMNGGMIALALATGSVVTLPSPAVAQWADCATAPTNSKQCVPSGNGGVGIGVTDPGSYKLFVQQGADNSTGGIRLQNSDNTGAFRVYKTASGFGPSVLMDQGVDTLYLKSGNVGIGTLDPSYQLDVRADGNAKLGATGYGTGNVSAFVLRGARGTQASPSALQAGDVIGYLSGGGYGATGFAGGGRAYIQFVAGENWSDNAQGAHINIAATPVGGIATANAMTILGGGNVGIGTATPLNALDIQRPTSAAQPSLRVRTADSGYEAYLGVDSSGLGWTGSTNGTAFAIKTAGAPRMYFNTLGNVGIGTIAPSRKLDVNGTIGAKEVVVTNTGWADYVFTPGYKLRPLTEVARFINENGHLPEIPSEAEVKQNGVSMGEMQAKLLAKVEELTLHLIQEHEQMQQQKARLEEINAELLKRIHQLEDR